MWLRNASIKVLIVVVVGLCACTWAFAAGMMAWRQSVTSASSSLQASISRPIPTPDGDLVSAGLSLPVESRPMAAPIADAVVPSSAERATTPPSRPSCAGSVPAVMVPATSERPVPTTAAPTPTTFPRPKTFNIMLLGTDRNQPGKGTWRTDVIALVMIEPESRVTGVLALPRDLYVDIPGHEASRINTVDFLGHYTKYPGGGAALLNRTLQENFGFGFDRFIRIDFAGFVEVVDTLGGIDLEVDCPLEEVFADPAYPAGRLLKLDAGPQHLDGNNALMFVRQRHDNGDTDRSRRQFKVLTGLREKALQIDTLPLIPKLFTSYRTSVQTDLSILEALELARWFYDWKTENIRGRIVDQTMATPWTTPKGSWVLLPDRERIAHAYQTILTAPRLVDAAARVGKCAKPVAASGS